MVANDLKRLKIGNKVKNLGSGRVYVVAEIDPEIILIRAVMGENLSFCNMAAENHLWEMLDAIDYDRNLKGRMADHRVPYSVRDALKVTK